MSRILRFQRNMPLIDEPDRWNKQQDSGNKLRNHPTHRRRFDLKRRGDGRPNVLRPAFGHKFIEFSPKVSRPKPMAKIVPVIRSDRADIKKPNDDTVSIDQLDSMILRV